ncbi:hypothetical protein ACHWQZ_G018076 [Mnemiopsis leidyi]
MLAHVAVFIVLLAPSQGGWVKIANFYQQPQYDEVLTPLRKSDEDLIVLAVDTEARQTRLALKETPYYRLSADWTELIGGTYFGRLSVFTRNYANVDVEHNLLKFQGNMSLGVDDRSIMSVVRNKGEFSGSLCNLGSREHGKKALVNVCLHNVTEYGNIDPGLIRFHVKQADCSDCTRHKVRPHVRGDSLEFGIPNSDTKPLTWNVTLEYTRHTTLCQFIKKLSPDDLNVIVMKQNLTVSSMFECVLFSQDVSSGGMATWIPVVAGLVSVVILGIAVTVFYKKCDKACVRQLIPTPDQDAVAAPYRSFNSSNSPRPDLPDNRYIKMRSMESSAQSDYSRCKQGSSSFSNRNGSSMNNHSEPYYERI